ncbi:MAG: hypothetical protein C0597_14440 [Marinilabiliales bacterium]|nr:MAG: hypothetical protein C0597_14440 [Marinilabiliales bacterium]
MNFKRTILYLIPSLIVFSVLFGCKKDDQTRLQAGWTSKDPIAIPFNARNHEKELGNLVNNSSFETGKVYYEESNVKSYDINGWKKVGSNIQWVNSNNDEFSGEEVYDGIHAIKIERLTADETEKIGEGIISDYIKVFPGNYSLRLYLKLKDVYPNQSRLGTKMYDAINIELQYFDKNKIEISGEDLNAFTRTKLNNSFKAFSLSNYSHIKEFGWGEIYGKTANFPYFDGDIPDEARYVKIFIGLKGTGTMWVDQVDFRYTDQNFTLLEKLKPYFDSSYMANDMIFPQPKHVVKKDIIDYYEVDSDQYPVIIIPEGASQAIEEAAKLLKENLIKRITANNSSIHPTIEIMNDLNFNLIKDQFVVSLGYTKLYQQFNKLPDTLVIENQDAYYIQQFDEAEKIVFVEAGNKESYFNAVKSLVQLSDSQSTKYYGANIIDYPDFIERNILLDQFDGDIDKLNNTIALFKAYKLNGVYFNWDKHLSNFPFKKLNELSNSNLKYGAFVNLLDNSNKSFYNRLVKENYSSIIFNSSDSLDCDEFNSNKKCSSDLDIISEFQHSVKKLNKTMDIGFIPRWSNLSSIDRGHEDVYFYFYNVNQSLARNIDLYWSGPSKYSTSIDHAELNRIKYIYNRTSSYIDNSLIGSAQRFDEEYINQYYAGKIRTQSFF